MSEHDDVDPEGLPPAPRPDDVPGAPAPLAENVVSMKSAKARKGKDAGATSASPPPTPENRDASQEGTGGAPDKPVDGGKPPKKEKKIDWGRYTYMVENFVLIYPTDTAWDYEKGKAVKISNMAHMYGADYVRMWKASPDRKSIDEDLIVFDPSGQSPEGAINLWEGLAVEAVECTAKEVEPMLKLLQHLCMRCDDSVSTLDEIMHWVLRWLALPLQKNGAKMATALVFHGPQGVGKNLFFDVVRDMYGRYGVMVGQTEIEEKYNGWISAKQMVICNEVVSRQELYHGKNRLKWMIDADRIPIRTMHTDTRWEQNWANLVFLSNENQPVAVEVRDRRHLVVYTPVPEDGQLYDQVRAFLAAGGAAKFLHYLLTYPLDDFHEHTKPPMTEAKQDLIELTMEPAQRFMHDWFSGFLHLPLNPCSVEQLYRAFKTWAERNGDRWVPNQAKFTNEAKKWALERDEREADGKRMLEPCMTYKVVTLAADGLSPRRSARCWIPRGCAPQNGITEGQWMAECMDAFDVPLSRFLRTREGSGDGDSSPAPSPAPSSGKKTRGDE